MDSILWADGGVATCPVYYSRTGGPDGITDALAISSGFCEFLLALAHLGEVVGNDSGEFEDKYSTEDMSPTKECEEEFLPGFTKILGSAEFGAAFMLVFFGER